MPLGAVDFDPLIEKIAKICGVRLDVDILRQGLTHSSFAFESRLPSNERLEFLGDSVLGMCVASVLYGRYPRATEGQLTAMHHNIVSGVTLCAQARAFDLGKFILLGKSEEQSAGRDKCSILSGALEAIVACIYLQGGYTAAATFVNTLFSKQIESAWNSLNNWDPKTKLLTILQKRGLTQQMTITQSGDSHKPTFVCVLEIFDRGNRYLHAQKAGAQNSKHRWSARCERVLLYRPRSEDKSAW